MSKAKSYFSIIDLSLAASFFIVMFIGNATLGPIPLNIFLLILILIFAPYFRANIIQLVVVIFSVYIFLLYAINVKISYSMFYPLWVINFFLGYFYIRIFNSRINRYPNSLLRAQFQICLALLLLFSIGIITYSMLGYSEEGRAFFIFGPNMLYRVLGFLSGICAGFLFFNGRRSQGFLLAALCLAILVQTGSRGAIFLMPILFLLWTHAHYKRLLFSNISSAVFVVIISIILIGTLTDIFAYRVINLSILSVDDSSSYLDSYSRWRPYLYLLQEPDRFSLIGINHQTYLDLFYSDGHIYPHSLLLELIMFYGSFGVVMCVYIIFKVSKLMRVMLTSEFTPGHLLYFSIFTSGIGVLFSGDMGDNGALLGMIIAMSDRVLRQNQNSKKVS